MRTQPSTISRSPENGEEVFPDILEQDGVGAGAGTGGLRVPCLVSPVEAGHTTARCHSHLSLLGSS